MRESSVETLRFALRLLGDVNLRPDRWFFWSLTLFFASVQLAAEPLAFVTNFGSDDVTVIDVASRAVVTTIAVGDAPVGVAIRQDGAQVYISNKAGFWQSCQVRLSGVTETDWRPADEDQREVR